MKTLIHYLFLILIDGLIEKAREHNLKLIFLWFGSWKNMVSTYASAWIINNPERFPLARGEHGERYQMLSTLSKEVCNGDSNQSR